MSVLKQYVDTGRKLLRWARSREYYGQPGTYKSIDENRRCHKLAPSLRPFKGILSVMGIFSTFTGRSIRAKGAAMVEVGH
jgi:hypothetical protein